MPLRVEPMSVVYEWDEEKAKANFKKHKVSFDEASAVFSDGLANLFFDEKHSADEVREIIVGYSRANRLLVVSFTERKLGIVRIISARAANKIERKDHEENQGI
jgi:uncharacterized protein